MSEFNIEVQGGSSVRLPTAGKYCEKDILVTASGGKEEQEKSVTITENGTTEIFPDEGKTLSKVAVNVEVESGGGDNWYDFTVTLTSECVNGQELLDALVPYLPNLENGKEIAFVTLQNDNIKADSTGIATTCIIGRHNNSFSGMMARYRANLTTIVQMMTGYGIKPYSGCTYYVKVVRVVA
jgi:hypothetical protein